jgi:hypothetical protein
MPPPPKKLPNISHLLSLQRLDPKELSCAAPKKLFCTRPGSPAGGIHRICLSFLEAALARHHPLLSAHFRARERVTKCRRLSHTRARPPHRLHPGAANMLGAAASAHTKTRIRDTRRLQIFPGARRLPTSPGHRTPPGPVCSKLHTLSRASSRHHARSHTNRHRRACRPRGCSHPHTSTCAQLTLRQHEEVLKKS